jgi:hypothetical protein
MNTSSSKERFKVMENANSTQGAGNISEMIQKAKMGNPSAADYMSSSSKD